VDFINSISINTVILILGVIWIIVAMTYWHKREKDSLDMRQMMMRGGKISLAKLGQLIAMLVSTWIIIYATTNGTLTEWLFTGYMFAWSGAHLIQRYLDRGTTSRGNDPTLNNHSYTDTE
jgi:hypothetical protein